MQGVGNLRRMSSSCLKWLSQPWILSALVAGACTVLHLKREGSFAMKTQWYLAVMMLLAWNSAGQNARSCPFCAPSALTFSEEIGAADGWLSPWRRIASATRRSATSPAPRIPQRMCKVLLLFDWKCLVQGGGCDCSG